MRFRGRGGRGVPLVLAVLLAGGAGVAYAGHELGLREGAVHLCHTTRTGEARVVQDPAQCRPNEDVTDVASYGEVENRAEFARPLTYSIFLADEWSPGDEGENQVAIPPIGDEGELGLIAELALVPGDLSADHTWVLSADLTLANPREQPRTLVTCSWQDTEGSEGVWTTLPATEPGGAQAEYHVPVHVTNTGFAVPDEDEGVFRLYCGQFGDAEGVYAHNIHLFATRTVGPFLPDEE